jgi:hypothetical protein
VVKRRSDLWGNSKGHSFDGVAFIYLLAWFSDYGWRMIQGDSQHNAFAHERWKLEVRTILAAHADCIAVEFDTHR